MEEERYNKGIDDGKEEEEEEERYNKCDQWTPSVLVCLQKWANRKCNDKELPSLKVDYIQ